MDTDFELVPVAFLHSTGGMVRVLLAVDRDGEQMADGDPLLLVHHRPGRPVAELLLEAADSLDPAVCSHVVATVGDEIVTVVEAAFGEDGMFDPQRMLDRRIRLAAPATAFDV